MTEAVIFMVALLIGIGIGRLSMIQPRDARGRFVAEDEFMIGGTDD
jgi:hypothetical protein